jgi:hypothetical protein
MKVSKLKCVSSKYTEITTISNELSFILIIPLYKKEIILLRIEFCWAISGGDRNFSIIFYLGFY